MFELQFYEDTNQDLKEEALRILQLLGADFEMLARCAETNGNITVVAKAPVDNMLRLSQKPELCPIDWCGTWAHAHKNLLVSESLLPVAQSFRRAFCTSLLLNAKEATNRFKDLLRLAGYIGGSKHGLSSANASQVGTLVQLM